MGNSWFGWGSTTSVPQDELPDIFPLALRKEHFIEIDCINIFQKILTDVIERTQGISDDQSQLLYDNCMASEARFGLIHMLARAMTFKRNLFLIYDKALGVLRKANSTEESQIQADYKKQGKSSVGVFISFELYLKADLVQLYSALEYVTIASLHKSMNLSAAIQMKMSDLRQSTGLNDSAQVKAQAISMAKALSAGRDILMDAKDVVANAVPDLTAITASIDYLSEKRAFYLGLPKSYLCGEMTEGIGTTGESDTKATERGLKNYYESIIRPVLTMLFDIKPTYKSQDFRQVTSGLDALKVFAVTDEEIISLKNKTLIINRLFDLASDSEGDGPDPVVEPIVTESITV